GERRVLGAPGVRAGAVDADREIGIEPDRHAVPARGRNAARELPIGGPLREFGKFTVLVMRAAKLFELRASGIAPGLRPLPPRRRRVLPAQLLEAGKAQQRFALLFLVGVEIGAARATRGLAERSMRQPQTARFHLGDARVSDQL